MRARLCLMYAEAGPTLFIPQTDISMLEEYLPVGGGGDLFRRADGPAPLSSGGGRESFPEWLSTLLGGRLLIAISAGSSHGAASSFQVSRRSLTSLLLAGRSRGCPGSATRMSTVLGETEASSRGTRPSSKIS